MESTPRWVRWRWGLCVAMGSIGVLASAWTSSQLQELESRALAASFRLDVAERQFALERALDESKGALHAAAGFRAATGEVTDRQFSTFVARLLERHPAVQAIGWDPVVRQADRRRHEMDARRAGHPEYRITERAAQGEMVSAAERAEYVPVRMIEPLAGNESAIGFDVASETSRLAALERARDTGALVISEPITLVQEKERQVGFLGILPQYGATEHSTPEQRRRSIRGYHVGVFRVRALVDSALEPFDRAGVDLRVYDVSAGDRQLLQERLADSSSDERVRVEAPTRSVAVQAGSRRWELEFSATPAYVRGHRSATPVAALIVGLIITALGTAYLALFQRAFVAREQSKLELEAAAERLHLTVDAVADGAWDWNIATDEIHVSDTSLTGLGYSRADAEGVVDFWTSLIHPEDLPRVLIALQEHLDGHTSVYECENRLRTKSGEYRWNLDRGRVVKRAEDGTALRMVGTDTDITLRKLAEQERSTLEERMRHSQKLESLGVLAGGIAHDFNNLLVGVLGSADVALREMPEDSPGRQHVERIKTSGARAAELTSQMLAYAGAGRMRVERLDLRAVVDEMSALLSASISKKAEFRREIGDEEPLVAGDATRLRQVVMNLITNASDALDGKSGTIDVRTGVQYAATEYLRTLEFGAERPPGAYSFVEVSDSGVGMTDEVRRRMFDPFFSTKFQGRGLGLAAVLGIVSSHNGAIDITSAPGAGTSIRVLLPFAARSIEARATTSERAPVSRWQHDGVALIIDDESGVREVVQSLLEACGFRVLTAVDGVDGVTTFREHADDIDLVVLDVAMPRRDGAETCREIRAICPTARVLFSSGFDETESINALIDGGHTGFIHKPYLANDFIAQVRALVES